MYRSLFSSSQWCLFGIKIYFCEEFCCWRNTSCEGQKGKSMHFNSNGAMGSPGYLEWSIILITVRIIPKSSPLLLAPRGCLFLWAVASVSYLFPPISKRVIKHLKTMSFFPFLVVQLKEILCFQGHSGEPLKTVMMTFTSDMCRDWNNHIGGSQYCRSFIQDAEVWPVTCEFKRPERLLSLGWDVGLSGPMLRVTDSGS